ncbi:hypothetical protein GCM10014719_35740 [Planomonospora parontospora subsp. antibiotica]|nr:hypothetical protein GCM10014719_35740 [Planomonospora parontospora subsp. antibiotica]GII16613.1 hypothetical protein Ppa05_33390 [Planomonospora parontospora subsp. antibiotica]
MLTLNGRILGKMKSSHAATRRILPGSPFNRTFVPPPPIEQYALNDRVSHDKYGLGVVIGVEDELAVLVDFGPEQRRITTPFAKMTRL